ncbi:MAG: anti-sigma regulatory factor (Ser/Thr protein kinase) [Phenylobacterium sp.]|jgi:anti-sigma regulatory factor (Ser/Thr protein kinase)
MAVKARGKLIRHQILANVRQHPDDIAAYIMQMFAITRQAVSKHLKKLVDEQWLIAHGSTQKRSYTLGPRRQNLVTVELNKNSDESQIFFEHFAWIVDGVAENIDEMVFIGFTEMVNNAIDHSQGSQCIISITRSLDTLTIIIADNGEGIFKRIKREYNLYDERQAIFELSKGKLTTDAENHSGQGIFFTSRMFDNYMIDSGGLCYSHDEHQAFDVFHDASDNAFTDALNNPLNTPSVKEQNTIKCEGTKIIMNIALSNERTAKSVYDAYTGSEEDDYSFNKTIVPVKLSRFGQEQLVSRSQAKRLLARIEHFEIVVLDFQDVNRIGQAFADEIFRVYATKNPAIELLFINENKEIDNMISRAKTS